MKPSEVAALPLDKLRRIVLMEARAKPRLRTTVGLWRKKNKKQGHDGTMTQFILDQKLLSAEEVFKIQQAPENLVAYQKGFEEGYFNEPFGVFLHGCFPNMFPQPVDRTLIQIDVPTAQSSLFEELR